MYYVSLEKIGDPFKAIKFTLGIWFATKYVVGWQQEN